MDSDDFGAVLFLLVLFLLVLFLFVGIFLGIVIGNSVTENKLCGVLAEQVHAVDYSANPSCMFSFEDGTWITQEKFFENEFKLEKEK